MAGKPDFDFDLVIDRRNTNSIKWDFVFHSHGMQRVSGTETPPGERQDLAMSVADMDFPAPPCITEALVARVEHGVFGYTCPDERYLEAVAAWHARRHGWVVEPEWIITYHGTVPALNLFCRGLIGPGAKVLIQTPAFPPFFSAIKNGGGTPLCNELINDDGRYRIDFDDLEVKASDPGVEMMILCNPHNPVGRAWTAEELSRVARICLRHGVLLVSDEVHGDLMFQGARLAPVGSLDAELAANTIICSGISKTFNLAGLGLCNLIAPDPVLRDRLRLAYASTGEFGANPLSLAAHWAAYIAGEPWLEAALRYIEDNFGFLQGFLASRLPAVKPVVPEATYLVWLDCRGLGLDQEALEKLFSDKAGVRLETGRDFGPGGEGFMRMNLACPRSVLAEALERIAEAAGSSPPKR